MAARAKKSRRKSGGKSASKRTAGKRRASRWLGKALGEKSAPGEARRRVEKVVCEASRDQKSAAKSPAIKKSAANAAARSEARVADRRRNESSPIARVTRVAKEVAQQASTAVTEGSRRSRSSVDQSSNA